MKNKLIIAAAGSGKTTYLVEKALDIKDESVLITTYTETNESEINKKIIEKHGCIPANIKVQTWFSFLLQHGIRPYQSILDPNIHDTNIGFLLSSELSGLRHDASGKPIIINGHPLSWGEKDFTKFYFTPSYKLYSDKLSKFVIATNEASGNLVIERISKIYKNIFIDEVQDLAGYDLEIIKLFLNTDSTILLVGDPRQVTYLTNHYPKYKKYSAGRILQFIHDEIKQKGKIEVDDSTLNVSHRNNQEICDFSSQLFPDLPKPSSCTCQSCRTETVDECGIFLIKSEDIEEYLSLFQPMQIRWNNLVECHPNHPVINFGQSKGLTFNRVLIYPTKPMIDWLKNHESELKDEARSKLYVGVTRAKYSVAIVYDYGHCEEIEGLRKIVYSVKS